MSDIPKLKDVKFEEDGRVWELDDEFHKGRFLHHWKEDRLELRFRKVEPKKNFNNYSLCQDVVYDTQLGTPAAAITLNRLIEAAIDEAVRRAVKEVGK